MIEGYGNCGSQAQTATLNKRITVADEVRERVESLNKRIYGLKDRVLAKLETVMTCPTPQCEERAMKGIEVAREYPPLFAAFRDSLTDMERNIATIEDALSRTEL